MYHKKWRSDIETSEISEIKKETSQDLQLFEVDDTNLVKKLSKTSL